MGTHLNRLGKNLMLSVEKLQKSGLILFSTTLRCKNGIICNTLCMHPLARASVLAPLCA